MSKSLDNFRVSKSLKNYTIKNINGILAGDVEAITNAAYRQLSKAKIDCDAKVMVQADGETIGQTPVALETIHAAIKLIVP